jgi:drug/metabolite transporter (DMT)-like permease
MNVTDDRAPASASARRPSPLPRTPTTGLALAFATALTSGVAVFANGYGVTAFGSGGGVYTTAKNLVAAVVLLLVGAVATKTRSDEGFTRPRTGREWAGLGVVAVIGGSVPFLLFFEGLARASSIQAAFLHKSLLIWVVLLAWPLLGERIGPLQVVAIGLLLVGQAALQGGVGEIGAGGGEVMILAATLLWSVEVIVAKRLLRSGVPVSLVAAARMAVGSAALFTIVAGTGDVAGVVAFGPEQWFAIGITTVLLTGYVLTWFGALKRAPATSVTSVLVVGAVITTMLQTLAVGGVPATSALIGNVILVAGAVVAVVGARAATPRPARAQLSPA